jgi:hypothetical protein
MGKSDRLGEPQPCELPRPNVQKPRQLRILAMPAAAKIDNAGTLIGDIPRGAAQTGPTLRIDFPLQARANFLLAAGTFRALLNLSAMLLARAAWPRSLRRRASHTSNVTRP